MYYDKRLDICPLTSLVTAGPLGNALQYGGSAPGTPTTDPTVLDLSVAQDVAEGNNLYVRLRVVTAFAVGGGTPRLIPAIVLADDTGLSSNVRVSVALGGGTPLLLGATDLIGSLAGFVASELAAGTELFLPIPPPFTRQRYMGIVFINPGWALAYWSAGSFIGHVEPAEMLRLNGPYPNAI